MKTSLSAIHSLIMCNCLRYLNIDELRYGMLTFSADICKRFTVCCKEVLWTKKSLPKLLYKQYYRNTNVLIRLFMMPYRTIGLSQVMLYMINVYI